MSRRPKIKVHTGFEIETGRAVEIELAHIFVTGQTQVSGKTTTLQAIVARSGCRALAFVTKRGEQLEGRSIRPYLPREGDAEIHWRFVETIMASALGQRALKYERLQIINAAKGAYSLEDVRQNITRLQAKAKGPAADIYTLLGEYLDLILPEMRALNASHELDLQPGLNVMDVTEASPELQALVIGAALQRINDQEERTLTVFPEAWQFAPRDRNTAAKFEAEKMARMGSVIGNFLLCDSQDIAGVSPVIRQASTAWIVGAQREQNELKRVLQVIKSSGVAAPKPSEIGTLGIGQFFVCQGSRAVKTYIQPAWMKDADAKAAAVAGVVPESPAATPQPKSMPAPIRVEYSTPPATPAQPESEADMSNAETNKKLDTLIEIMLKQQGAAAAPQSATAPSVPVPEKASVFSPDEESLYARFKARLLIEMPPSTDRPLQVTPPEKLRKEFQVAEAERILVAARALRPLQKQIVKLIEGVGDILSMKRIAERLGRPTGGGSWIDLSKAVKELAAIGFVKNLERQGVTKALRDKIEADLADYKPAAGEVEAVYQTVLAAIANGEIDGGAQR